MFTDVHGCSALEFVFICVHSWLKLLDTSSDLETQSYGGSFLAFENLEPALSPGAKSQRQFSCLASKNLAY